MLPLVPRVVRTSPDRLPPGRPWTQWRARPPRSVQRKRRAENETVDIALDDHIFYADFVGLYNAAATRQPERLPQTAGGPDGGSAAAGSVSGRDIIDNVDENGKRFAECREKLKAWQNWARKMDLAK